MESKLPGAKSIRFSDQMFRIYVRLRPSIFPELDADVPRECTGGDSMSKDLISPVQLHELVRRISARDDRHRTEADLQSDIRTLLLYGGLSLETPEVVRLEEQTRDGTRRRLDVAIGQTVLEVKKDLRSESIRASAEEQLSGYLQSRSQESGARYNGVLTDGVDWYLYYVSPTQGLERVSCLAVDPSAPNVTRLTSWLESVLATARAVLPTPDRVTALLGADSPAYRLDRSQLAALYDLCREDPEVQLKRQLWASFCHGVRH